tara:strand:- start:240 stop:473 length:234 start_codon:yes stop_codon:yes gene_type:complete
MADPVETISWWTNVWDARDAILGGVLGVVAAASLVVNGTKTPDPNSIMGKAYKVIEWLSLTFGRAKQTGIEDKNKAE